MDYAFCAYTVVLVLLSLFMKYITVQTDNRMQQFCEAPSTTLTDVLLGRVSVFAEHPPRGTMEATLTCTKFMCILLETTI